MSNRISRRSFAAQCVAAASLTATGGYAAQGNGSRPTLRVVTYNIHHGEGTDRAFDYERQADLINKLAPDVVALQEVDRGTGRARGADQAQVLAKLTGLESVYGKAMYYDGGEYGEAILSKHTLREAKSHPLPFRFGQEPRAALAVRVESGDALPSLLFVGTHLCHQSRETRTEQAQHMNRLFPAAGGMPIVLAGDFNARPGSRPMHVLLKDHWRDAIAPASRIDYVLFRQSDPWRVVNTTIVDDRVASDHRPVLAVLEWHGGDGA